MILIMCSIGEDVPQTDNSYFVPTTTATTTITTTTTTTSTTTPTTVTTSTKPTEVEPAFRLSDKERRIVECVVMGEASGESFRGQMLVAQCLLNACLKDGLQPSESRVKYKYSGWDNNPSESVKEAVSAVFDDGLEITDEPILYFYAPKHCNGKWHETQVHVITVGNHKFFKEHKDWRS
jgi:spore germination cell wall hydrolase CwlJ-like protein